MYVLFARKPINQTTNINFKHSYFVKQNKFLFGFLSWYPWLKLALRGRTGVHHIIVNPDLGLKHVQWSSYFLES